MKVFWPFLSNVLLDILPLLTLWITFWQVVFYFLNHTKHSIAGWGGLGIFLVDFLVWGFFWWRMTDVVIILFINKLVKSPEHVCTWRQKDGWQSRIRWNKKSCPLVPYGNLAGSASAQQYQLTWSISPLFFTC